MKRQQIGFALFGLLAIYTFTYETKSLQQFKFQIPELQGYNFDSLSASISSSIYGANSTTNTSATNNGNLPEVDREAGLVFRENMTYLDFRAMHPDSKDLNYTALAANATASPLLEYFPDFCFDCTWGGNGMACAGRALFLTQRYGTKNPEEAVMNERNGICKNPHLKIFWQDDGVDELDSMFAQPRTLRGNITTSPLVNISIYFYETLRKDVGEELVDKMRHQYAQRNNSETNGQADIAIIDLFSSYPGRTDDPAKADMFVVPYPAASHCISKPTGVWLQACNHISDHLIKGGVFATLTHYKGNENRHLFLNVLNQGNTKPIMRSTPLSITIGPRYQENNIIVPYLNNLASFQPSVIRSHDKSWWTRPRTYAITYFFGISNSKMKHSPRIWRKTFMEEVQTKWPDSLGGMPYAIRVMTRGHKPPSRFFTHMYKDSIFCPTLPGDTPPQKRFFDVIMMGCIPVVLAFETAGGGKISWHQPGGAPMENSYPWAKGAKVTQPENEIDYRSFVVEVHGGVENFRPTLEALMQNYTEIRRRQLNLMKYAPLLSYGMASDSHKHPDAFSKILESLRYSLDNQ